MLKALVIVTALMAGSLAFAQENTQDNVVEFHIAAGTSGSSWNTRDTMVKVVIGDTLRVFNDDSVAHQLHTNGAPCSHGARINPGQSWDCRISRSFDPLADGPLYDHGYGPSAEFWVTTLSAD